METTDINANSTFLNEARNSRICFLHLSHKLLAIFLLCLMASFISACNPQQQQSYADRSYTDQEQPLPQKTHQTSPYLIKTGEIRFETTKLNKTREQIDRLIQTYDAYVAEENQYNYTSRIEQRITLRIPSGNFDSLVEDILSLVPVVEYKQVKVVDVTEAYIDVQARLKNRKELESRYINLLSEAKNVSEILAIEQQMGKHREEIESIEGRLAYLQDQVAMATVELTLYEKTSGGFQFGSKIAQGLENGWFNLLSFIIGLVNIWPFIILLILLIYFWRPIRKYLWRKRKTKNQE